MVNIKQDCLKLVASLLAGLGNVNFINSNVNPFRDIGFKLAPLRFHFHFALSSTLLSGVQKVKKRVNKKV